MDVKDFALAVIVLIILGEACWIRYLTKKYHSMLAALGRASAKVAQHKILVTELRELLEEEADLDKCLREEINGKAWARAREVVYEQNFERAKGESPWTPKANPK